MSAPALHSGAATLRPLSLADAPGLFPAFADAINMTYWSGPPHASVEETEGDIIWWLAHNGESVWAITDAQGALCGRIGLLALRTGVAEVGIILRRDARGRGLARGAVEAATAYGFSALGMHRIVADIDPANQASRKLFRACGYRREARMRRNWRTHIGLRDSLIYVRFAPPGSLALA